MTSRRARVAGVVLAAGGSTRMGTNKLALPVEGKPIVLHVIDALLEAGVTPVFVVTGHERARLEALLSARPITVVHHADHTTGMGKSIACGVRAVAANTEGALVCVGDLPRLRAHHVTQVLSAFDGSTGTEIVVPTSGGRRGHPVLFGVRHFAALRALQGDRGARAILEAHQADVREIGVGDDAVVRDVDTWDDVPTSPSPSKV